MRVPQNCPLPVTSQDGGRLGPCRASSPGASVEQSVFCSGFIRATENQRHLTACVTSAGVSPSPVSFLRGKCRGERPGLWGPKVLGPHPNPAAHWLWGRGAVGPWGRGQGPSCKLLSLGLTLCDGVRAVGHHRPGRGRGAVGGHLWELATSLEQQEPPRVKSLSHCQHEPPFPTGTMAVAVRTERVSDDNDDGPQKAPEPESPPSRWHGSLRVRLCFVSTD